MRAEELKGWLAAAQRGEKKGEIAEKEGGGRQDTREGAENLERVVELVQTDFWDGVLAEEATWKAVVLVPKGEKEREAETKDGGEAGRTTVWERRTGRGWER